MLELQNIHKIYQRGTVNETCLFSDFSLTVPDKQFVCIVGSNGSGKTSLLNIICGSIPIDEGTILIGGENITRMSEHKRLRRIGRVYQDPTRGTCPSMTILENMSMADNKGKPFNLMPCVNDRLRRAFIIFHVFSDHKEGRFYPVFFEYIENYRRIARMRSVVKGKSYLHAVIFLFSVYKLLVGKRLIFVAYIYRRAIGRIFLRIIIQERVGKQGRGLLIYWPLVSMHDASICKHSASHTPHK